MTGDKPKWVYSFILLFVTLAWAVCTILVVRSAMADPSAVGVIEASGTGVLLGSLIAWNTNVNQYWFRKKPPQ